MSTAETATSPQQPEPSTQADDYSIAITNCNSISEAEITLRRGSLNIKYGPNGIGKSTIARALVLNASDDDALRHLLPFKYRQGAGDEAPAVVGAEEIKNVLVFDEQYVAQFVFQPDEVVANSFEIFINTPEYQEGIDELESIFENLKGIFLENEALDEVIASFTELRNASRSRDLAESQRPARVSRRSTWAASSQPSQNPSEVMSSSFGATTPGDGCRGSRKARAISSCPTTAPSARCPTLTRRPRSGSPRSTSLRP